MRCLLWVVVYPGEYQHLIPSPANGIMDVSTIRRSSNLSWCGTPVGQCRSEHLSGRRGRSRPPQREEAYPWSGSRVLTTLSVGTPALFFFSSALENFRGRAEQQPRWAFAWGVYGPDTPPLPGSTPTGKACGKH